MDKSDPGERPGPGPWRATLAGLCASLVGIGLARFAYTPLIPVLIEAEWFSASDVIYLGAANLAGYLAGALLARPMAARLPAGPILKGMMLLATAAFVACATPLSFAWFFVWRFASGLAGGALMALAAPTVLPLVPAGRQGLASGLIFTGVGLGIAASGTLVPPLLTWGLAETWLTLGGLSLLLTLLAWRGWPSEPAVPVATAAAGGGSDTAPRRSPLLIPLYITYGLIAVGLVPHMVFLVDFVARDLGRGLAAGAGYWVIFGLGAMCGPVLAGAVADRIGFGPALRLACLAQAACVGWLALSDGWLALGLSSLVIGGFVPGVVPLTLGRVRELVPNDLRAQRAAWSLATVAFALGQAAAAYGFSFLFARTADYPLLFALGCLALLAALLIDLGGAALAARRPAASRGG